ncbi:TPA: hypothetical protein ACGJRA_000318 [Pseudomonas aeruginosa]|uniref:hypothetical protein n=1 Tax=Pseudomonas aeruginosa TaxID=287 RepID=UPI0002CA09BD|nr:hypothetical protein [Pseudomonas aeruginosa]EMZ50107.1 hypothetical protein HMPREF1223_12291 [Pseudomonas aeruginosa str. Stone 130]RQA57845.1 hypothetical protein IPC483_23135 [Pseudomonas aeruginosa]HBO3269645.1 hypothetical protein [Pseudomonas aeruginosa]HBP0489676.1 hypothetical protein [Pseudomonas aeruginosa]HBP5437334.1 hypothetical protein [Pseudomonas aeruginosa]
MSYDRFGVFFQCGFWEKTVAFRVNNPLIEGTKIIVCGQCIDPADASDSRNIGGSFLCEDCGLPFGRPEAHEKAIALSGLEKCA